MGKSVKRNNTYEMGKNMAQRTEIKKILIINYGSIIIGQACEIDYSGTQVCKAISSLGSKC